MKLPLILTKLLIEILFQDRKHADRASQPLTSPGPINWLIEKKDLVFLATANDQSVCCSMS